MPTERRVVYIFDAANTAEPTQQVAHTHKAVCTELLAHVQSQHRVAFGQLCYDIRAIQLEPVGVLVPYLEQPSWLLLV